MSFNISYVYRAIDKFTPIANKIAKSVDNIKDKIKQSGIQITEFGKALANGGLMADKFKSGLDRATLSAQRLGSTLRLNNAIGAGAIPPPMPGGDGGGVKRMAIGSAMMAGGKKIKSAGMALLPMSAGIDTIGILSIKAAAQMQTMQIGFDAMLGSATKGKKLMREMQELTLHTPFILPDIADSARRLLAANIPAKDMTKTISFLGNIASGANKPLSQMVNIFAKVHNQGKAMGLEFRMMANMGVNMRDILLKGMTESGKKIDLKRLNQLIAKGLITPQIFDAALHTLTDKGGMYFNMMRKKMDSLSGAWSNVQHTSFVAGSIFGLKIAEIIHLQQIMEWFSETILHIAYAFQDWADANPILAQIVTWIGILLGILAPVLVLIGLMATGFGALATGIGFIGGAILTLTTEFGLLTIAMAANPLVRFVLVLTAVTIAVMELIDCIHDLWIEFTKTNVKIPDWIQTILDAQQASGGFTFEGSQLSGAGISPTNGLFSNKNSTVDVNINLEPVDGFKATAKGSVTGLGAGDLGMNMMGGY